MQELTSVRDRFTRIYDRNEWGGGSGTGALIAKNGSYITFLENFIERNDVRSVVDFGCGDWQFSRHVNWSGIKYTGIDVVETVIESNRNNFTTDNISFEIGNDPAALPVAELLVSKDVFQHLPNEMVIFYLEIFRRKYKLMLITNDDYPNGGLNQDIEPGGWRPIRLDRPPFSAGAAVVFSWVVESRVGLTRKATSLLYGEAAADPA